MLYWSGIRPPILDCMPSLLRLLPLICFFVFALVGCNEPQEIIDSPDTSTMNPSPKPPVGPDKHSYSRPDQVVTTHLNLEIIVDFDQKVIRGTASYDITNKTGAKEVIFDTRNLRIKACRDAFGNELAFELGDEYPTLGRPLTVNLGDDTRLVAIQFETTAQSDALQWLDPVQTADKQHPFLFTQGQAILTRTWLPCQDSPGIRFTYDATVKVPKELLPVMSADNLQAKNGEGTYFFQMKQPIPAYLVALAIGDLEFGSIGNRTGVYAEPSVLESAVYEFGDMEKMLEAAEELYGSYRWERYDVIVLPPSFPFGGMENPRLTFATPTILAGDRSLTALIAHELAHSWSGNLVTNATWDDFWLNEGFTVYFERRIMEALYGDSYAQMLALLGYQDLEHTLEELGPEGDDTRLKIDLTGRDPDDGMTDIAYEKGNFFLTHIEQQVGREKFDAFLKTYFETHAFKTMTTEAFVNYLNKELIGEDEALAEKIQVDAWIYQPGIPAGMVVPESNRFALVDEKVEQFMAGTKAAELAAMGTKDWTTHEWLHFIRHLPEAMNLDQMQDLDAEFNFSSSGNSEILAAWFDHVILHDYEVAYPALEDFLLRVGRRKFLKPIYTAMAKTDAGHTRAMEIYKKARPNYHAVSTGTIDEILGWNPEVDG